MGWGGVGALFGFRHPQRGKHLCSDCYSGGPCVIPAIFVIFDGVPVNVADTMRFTQAAFLATWAVPTRFPFFSLLLALCLQL